ncbi:hypothetical protein ABNQ39_15500 [Azospirillum sp. A26]|uniref:hypothetical protein n=1 Tax=Azospirillum sp. A26 TaxID=3160607 RepID=UPI00366B36A6
MSPPDLQSILEELSPGREDPAMLPVFWSKGISRFCDVSGPDWYWRAETESVQNEDFFGCHYGNAQGIVWIRLGTKARDGLPCDLDHFADSVLSRIDAPFVLVTTDGDATVPSDLKPETVRSLLSCPWLKAWYTQNHDGTHSPRIRPVPIGLDLHTLGPSTSAAGLVRDIATLRAGRAPARTQPLKVLCDFNPNTAERLAAYRSLSNCPNVLGLKTRVPQLELWTQYTRFPFVLSARGNGIDCHRTWEALYLGSIVITLSSSINPLFDSLPVVVVDSWDEVREQGKLERWLDQFGDATAGERVWRHLHPQRYIEIMRAALSDPVSPDRP